MRYLRQALPLVTAVALAVILVSATPAQAMNDRIECGGVPFLATAYGPLAQCVHVATDNTGEVGFWSPLAHSFNDTTGRVSISSIGNHGAAVATAGDGAVFNTYGAAVVDTPYGPVIYATQFQNGAYGPLGRWGVWNLVTHLFYPSSDWMIAT